MSSVQKHSRSGEGECNVFLKNALDCSRTQRNLKKISKNAGFVDSCSVRLHWRYTSIFFTGITMNLGSLIKVTFVGDYDNTCILYLVDYRFYSVLFSEIYRNWISVWINKLHKCSCTCYHCASQRMSFIILSLSIWSNMLSVTIPVKNYKSFLKLLILFLLW